MRAFILSRTAGSVSVTLIQAAVAWQVYALELDPGNGEIQGRLYQIEEILARRKRLAAPK